MVQVPGPFAAFSRDRQTKHPWLFGSEAERMKDSYQFFFVFREKAKLARAFNVVLRTMKNSFSFPLKSIFFLEILSDFLNFCLLLIEKA